MRQKIWPSTARRATCLGLIIVGPIGVVAFVLLGLWPVAVAFAVLPLLGASLVGWVEIAEEEFVDRRLIGDSPSVRFEDVNEVGIGMHQIRKTKLWYPEITTVDGQSVKFQSLKSLSGQGTLDRVEAMFLACKAKLPDVDEDAPIEAVSVGADGELEFAAAPTYEAYLREKAKEEAAAATAPPMPSPEVEPTPPPAEDKPAPRLLVAVESPPDIGEIDEEPDVFEPRPLTPRREKKPLLTIVPDLPPETETPDVDAPDTVTPEAVGGTHLAPTPTWAPAKAESANSEPLAAAPLVPPPIPMAPPTVIEQPKRVAPKAVEAADGSGRQFTSLFRRFG